MGDYIVQKLKDIVHYTTLDKRPIILLTDWGRATHICVSKLTIIGSDNVLSPDRCQAIIWTNAWLLLIGPLGTNFSEILIEIIFIQENAFESVVSETASILSRPQSVNRGFMSNNMTSGTWFPKVPTQDDNILQAANLSQ